MREATSCLICVTSLPEICGMSVGVGSFQVSANELPDLWYQVCRNMQCMSVGVGSCQERGHELPDLWYQVASICGV